MKRIAFYDACICFISIVWPNEGVPTFTFNDEIKLPLWTFWTFWKTAWMICSYVSFVGVDFSKVGVRLMVGLKKLLISS